jgi:predicted dehydrogenase
VGHGPQEPVGQHPPRRRGGPRALAAGRLERLLHRLRPRRPGDGPPPVDPWDAVTSLEVLDAARTSAATGQVVEPAITGRPG